MHRVLIADDEVPVCDMLRRALRRASPAAMVDVARSGPQALRLLTSVGYDVAILDIFMPGMDGLQVARTARARGVDAAIIALTGKGTLELAAEAVRSEVQDFVLKPVKLPQLVRTVQRLLSERHPSAHALAVRLDLLLQERLADPGLRLADLCRQLSISSSYATQIFRRHLGTTFRRRLAERRTERARQLLISSAAPLAAIAAQCGFRSPSRFTETFSRIEGTPPSQFRRRRRQEGGAVASE